MVGNWRINAWTAVFGALLTLLINLSRNPLDVSGLRALGAAVAFWLLGYALRFLLTLTLPEPTPVPMEDTAYDRKRVSARRSFGSGSGQ